MNTPSVDSLLNAVKADFFACPEGYENAIKKATGTHIRKNQIPVETRVGGTPVYRMNSEYIQNRIAHQVATALLDNVKVKPTESSVEYLITKRKKYSIMLSTEEERVLINTYQNAEKSGDGKYLSDVMDVAITFLSPRLTNIYRNNEAGIRSHDINEDVAQEMVIGLLVTLKNFDLEKTTAGLVPSFFNMRVNRAVTDTIRSARAIKLSSETWRKIYRFDSVVQAAKRFREMADGPADPVMVNAILKSVEPTEEEMRLIEEYVKKGSVNRTDIGKAYHAGPGVVDAMLAFAEFGSLDIAVSGSVHRDNDTKNAADEVCPIFFAQNDDGFDNAILQADMKRVLDSDQYKVVTLRNAGYEFSEIAELMGWEDERKARYCCRLARGILKATLDREKLETLQASA